MSRTAEITRKTNETNVSCTLCICPGVIAIDTGIGFFDHMLHSLAFHAGWTLDLKAKGDYSVDAHHTVEDVGIVLGSALGECLGDRVGISRFGEAHVPMDEALAFCSVDISGRPFLVYDADMPQSSAGSYDYCLNEEFFRAFAFNSGITLHIKSVYGRNAHHMTESIFKCVARSLRTACALVNDSTCSTKGVL